MALESSAERMAMLAAIIESSEDAIISKNLNGIITSWNKGAETVFEFSEKEAVGQHISLIIPRERLSEEEMIISKLKNGEKIEHFETIRMTKSGKDLNISLSISPIRNESGKIIGASKIARDITRQKETEALNAKLLREVQALNQTKDEFIGYASHELKTPLTTISGYIQLLEKVPEKTAQFLPKINKQISRLSGIISDLLDISKIQAGKFELNKSTIALNDLIKESVESARQLSDGHEIVYSLPHVPVMLKVDIGKMTQVIMNIISNAIKYSQAGSRIEINVEKLADDIRISIKDHGIGIPKEDLENVFLQFYRISSTGNKAEGLGLGLFLCKKYIEAHQGSIWAESTVGEGTTVHISIPI